MTYKHHQGMVAVTISLILSFTFLAELAMTHRHALALIESRRTERAFVDSLHRRFSREHRHMTFYHLRQLSHRLRVLEEKKSR